MVNRKLHLSIVVKGMVDVAERKQAYIDISMKITEEWQENLHQV